MCRSTRDRGRWSRASAIALLAGASVVASPGSAREKDSACAPWIAKKGYAHDYIEQRLGVRAPEPGQWISNIQRNEIDSGDVVTLKQWPGHVAVIDSIERDGAGAVKRIKVSDFNALGQWQDRPCAITTNFGKEQSRWVAAGEIDGQWRPPRPRRY